MFDMSTERVQPAPLARLAFYELILPTVSRLIAMTTIISQIIASTLESQTIISYLKNVHAQPETLQFSPLKLVSNTMLTPG